MNKTDARKLADILTNQQIYDMFMEARASINRWGIRSQVNKSMTKGAAWNLLAANFDVTKKHHILGKKNMIWEFGDHLPDEILSTLKKTKTSLPKITIHQEPNFDNYPPIQMDEDIMYGFRISPDPIYPKCIKCDNPYPHLYENGGGHCEDCNHQW